MQFKFCYWVVQVVHSKVLLELIKNSIKVMDFKRQMVFTRVSTSSTSVSLCDFTGSPETLWQSCSKPLSPSCVLLEEFLALRNLHLWPIKDTSFDFCLRQLRSVTNCSTSLNCMYNGGINTFWGVHQWLTLDVVSPYSELGLLSHLW